MDDIWTEVKTSSDYKACSSVSNNKQDVVTYVVDMCSISSCRKVMNEVAKYPKCEIWSGWSNKDYSCDEVIIVP